MEEIQYIPTEVVTIQTKVLCLWGPLFCTREARTSIRMVPPIEKYTKGLPTILKTSMLMVGIKIMEKEYKPPRLSRDVSKTLDTTKFLIHGKTGQGDILITIIVAMEGLERYVDTNRLQRQQI